MPEAFDPDNMTPVETEMVEATGFSPRRAYKDRQDYLAALAHAVNALEREQFDKLSDDAVDWFNNAANSVSDKELIEDFPDLSAEGDEAGEGEGGAEEPAEETAEETPAEEPAEEESAEEAEAEEPAAKPAKKGAKKAAPAKPAKAAAKAPAKPLKPAPALARRPKGQPPRKMAHAPIKRPDPDTKLEDLHLSLDKFGVVKGTKNAAALDLLEKGCRMSDVTESIGGTYYNLLQRMVKAGHHLEKGSNGHLKLTHKDEVSAKPKSKGKK